MCPNSFSYLLKKQLYQNLDFSVGIYSNSLIIIKKIYVSHLDMRKEKQEENEVEKK